MAKNGALSGAESASVEVAKAQLARKVLLDASKEVRSSFPRESAGTELVLIDVDPHRLHAFWTIPVALMEDARVRPGGAGAAMVLRVFPLANGVTPTGSFFDVEVGGLKGRAYVEIWQPERRYTARLGLRTAGGEFVAFASANEIALPPAGPAPEPTPPAQPAPADEAAAADDPFPQLFDLDAVLPVSSYILAGDRVAFEATAELHIHGHAQPGSTVRLFGREVPVRPDGSFSVVHVLDHDSPLLASILAAAAAEPKAGPEAAG
ncbi:MAG: DUF4912 domain-containing protein [Rhodospirillales bacterium]|jgi:hypothetical protein|nr:DUF4912 domain-containing protein [Rhodospirillales bacterium]